MSEDPITRWSPSPERRLSFDDSNTARLAGAAKDELSKMLYWWDSLILRDCMGVFVLRPFETSEKRYWGFGKFNF